jgi:hypothetical protein
MSTERWWWGCPASTFKLVLPAPAWRAAAAATEMHACMHKQAQARGSRGPGQRRDPSQMAIGEVIAHPRTN